MIALGLGASQIRHGLAATGGLRARERIEAEMIRGIFFLKQRFVLGLGLMLAALLSPAIAAEQDTFLRAPHAAPAILQIVLPDRAVDSGQVVHASVYATSNTASVEARIYGFGMPLERVGVGRFRLVYRVPSLPFFLKRAWPVQVIARNVDGQTDSRAVTISVR